MLSVMSILSRNGAFAEQERLLAHGREITSAVDRGSSGTTNKYIFALPSSPNDGMPTSDNSLYPLILRTASKMLTVSGFKRY